MKLLYKGLKPTKAHTNDVGFDLHPTSIHILFNDGSSFFVDGLQDMQAAETEKKIEEALSEHTEKYPIGSDGRGISKLVFDTGTAISPPTGIWMMLCANSRVCKTSGLVMQNGVGIVDPGYRGTIKATYLSTDHTYDISDVLMLCRTCGQLIPFTTILPEAIEVDELDETERGSKGFGSSDRK